MYKLHTRIMSKLLTRNMSKLQTRIMSKLQTRMFETNRQILQYNPQIHYHDSLGILTVYFEKTCTHVVYRHTY